MSFYRNFTLAFATFALSTIVFAADESNNIQSQQVSVKTTTTTAQPAATQEAKVNINTATMKELMDVKGMSRVKAKNIITYRKKHGNFKSVDDLKLVKGFKKIKQDNLKTIQNQLTVE